jgi:hypothetical protein
VLGILAIAAGVLSAVYLHGMGQKGPDLSRTKTSAAGLFVATLAPTDAAVRQGQMQSWTLTLKTPSGLPVENAAIDISGGMPQHNHGLPTSPQVTDYLGQGRYRIDGVKFTMSGWWQLRLSISSAAGSDTVVFNIVL